MIWANVHTIATIKAYMLDINLMFTDYSQIFLTLAMVIHLDLLKGSDLTRLHQEMPGQMNADRCGLVLDLDLDDLEVVFREKVRMQSPVKAIQYHYLLLLLDGVALTVVALSS
jgi:hypothetical protein